MARSCKVGAELVDHGRFADAWNAGNADAVCVTCFGQQRLKELLGKVLMRALAAFDQRDGTGQHGAFTRKHPLNVIVQRKRFAPFVRHGHEAGLCRKSGIGKSLSLCGPDIARNTSVPPMIAGTIHASRIFTLCE